jgi:hypothetical protein
MSRIIRMISANPMTTAVATPAMTTSRLGDTSTIAKPTVIAALRKM